MPEESPSYDTEIQSIVDYDADLSLLAQFRKTETDARVKIKELQVALEASPEYRSQLERMRESQDCGEKLANTIKANAVQEYLANDEKRPHSAVSIRLVTSLAYDALLAKVWCEHNLPTAIKLDCPLFEKHARAVADTQPLGFVKIEKQPQAAISTDLSEYLPPEDHTPVEIDFDKIDPVPV
jgi:hypothetical protein